MLRIQGTPNEITRWEALGREDWDYTSRLHESALAAMRAIEGDMSPSEIAEALRRARSSATRTP